MTGIAITAQLSDLLNSSDLIGDSRTLTKKWESDSVGIQAIEPVLRFIERNPLLNFGMPGPLVHYIEKYYTCGYEELLEKSIKRMPTPYTVWMLNRIINGQSDVDSKNKMIELLKSCKLNDKADEATLSIVDKFLSLHNNY